MTRAESALAAPGKTTPRFSANSLRNVSMCPGPCHPRWYGRLQASIRDLFAVGLMPDQIYYLADAILLPGKRIDAVIIDRSGVKSAGGGTPGFGAKRSFHRKQRTGRTDKGATITKVCPRLTRRGVCPLSTNNF